MKYIRTKDGTIINVTGKKIVKSYYDMKPDEICVNCEYREAATIEELCDDFVFIRKVGRKLKYVCYKEDYFDMYFYEHDGDCRYFDLEGNGHEIRKEYEIYGSVWTEKGLIYVAKMNDTGELELL